MSGWAWALFALGMVGAFVGPWMMWRARRPCDDVVWAAVERRIDCLRRECDELRESWREACRLRDEFYAEKNRLKARVMVLEAEARLPRIQRRNRRARGTVRP